MEQKNFRKIEKKWQKKWEEKKIFEVKFEKFEQDSNLRTSKRSRSEENKNKKKFYVLEMFPYPSGDGLHLGHALNYTIGDIRARFLRMSGFNVLYPMGFDSFGLPAENAAIKAGIHPRKYTESSIKNFINQQKALGLSYDWSKMLSSCEPEYYLWDQFFFLKFLENGLAYRKKSPVNWCPKCNTVLANEQVHNGKCEYHSDTDVEIKHLEQWFLKISKYADELLEKLDGLNWPQRIKSMQKNWIGKSHGTEIDFEVISPKASEDLKKSSDGEKFPIFTTRPDTIYGVTFMVISAQHPCLREFITDEQEKEVMKFLKKIKTVSQKSMNEVDELNKEGVFTGSYAINPITKEKVPIWAGNFVVADYGSGMVMAVPAHDQRDFEFAKKYKIEIKIVIQPANDNANSKKISQSYTGEGILVNSGEFNGMNNLEASDKITKFLQRKKLGRKTINYKLRDWLISRQRYWGAPIPVVYCDKCGIVPVPEKDLPIKLPEKVKFGKGNPLETASEWVNTKCPKCKGKARRETDTMDTFIDSSWYYLRYPDNKNKKEPFDKKIIDYWLPVDTYIGGAEHATMHLIYARFWTKALRDLGFAKFDEPFLQLFNQGMLHAEDGRKMSKSLGNVINPLDIVEKNGADALRLTLMSFASPDSDTNWDEKVLIGSDKFLNKICRIFEEVKIKNADSKTESKLNVTIKNVTEHIRNFKYNLAIIKLRNLTHSIPQETSREVLEKFLKLLHPFCPHITEELWEKLGNKSFISLEKWPVVDEKKIDDKFEKQEQAVEKLIEDITHILKIVGDKSKVYVYILPNEKDIYSGSEEEIKRKTNLEIKIFAVNDKSKYDPEGKSKKAKPGKPAIYLE